MTAPVLLDLNEIFPGKVELKNFEEKLCAVDWKRYQDLEVRIKGCAPTWAHLLVASRLMGRVKKLEFLIDDGKGGIPIKIY